MTKDCNIKPVEESSEVVSRDRSQLILGLMILEALVCATPLLATIAFFFADFAMSMFFLFFYYYFVFFAWALSLTSIFCLRTMRNDLAEGVRWSLSLMTFSEIILFGCVVLSTSGFYGFSFAWMFIFAGLGILGFIIAWLMGKRRDVLLRQFLAVLSFVTLVLDIVVLILTLVSA